MSDMKNFILKTFINSVINTTVAIVMTGTVAFLYLRQVDKDNNENSKKKVNIGTIKTDF